MLPLICSMLPPAESLEAIELNKKTILPGPNKSATQAKCDLNARIAKILLCVAEEAANAILDMRYKDFDPIVKNFGCQINAVEINELCNTSRDELCAEAERIKQFVAQNRQQLIGRPPKLDGAKSLAEYLINNAKLDMQVSRTMARLVRMRLLCIVNKDVPKEGKAVPRTHVELLCAKLGTNRTPNQTIKSVMELIVGGLQAEESKNAVCYIRARAATLPESEIRCPLIMRALTLERASRVKTLYLQTPIVSVPLMFNTEAAIASYKGVICVKNKIKFCDEDIIGAEPKKVFLRLLPEERLVDITNLPDEEPIVVIEGYINNNTNIASRIMELGLMNIIKANCAPLSQYASGADKRPIEDAEAEQEVARFASATYNQYRSKEMAIEIDHIYTASIREEK